MMTPTLPTIARTLILIAIYFQIYSMIRNKNREVNPYAFLLYAIGAAMMIYVYYKEDGDKITQRTTYKILITLGLFAITVFAYDPKLLRF